MQPTDPMANSSAVNPKQWPQQPQQPQHAHHSVNHVLLDIEGSTCPVSFVVGELFPYASAKLGAYLQEHGQEPGVKELLRAVLRSWETDDSEAAFMLLRAQGSPDAVGPEQLPALEAYLQLLIQEDRKLSALKELQGLIWRQGYAEGHLRAPLFEDVPRALRRWHGQGLVLAVYSSGSVEAQKLLYGHSNDGDLRHVFSHWFDTQIGPKKEASSYSRIAESMGCKTKDVLFISDSCAELEAAAKAGMAVLFSVRPGNPERDTGAFRSISNFADLNFPVGGLGSLGDDLIGRRANKT